MAIVLAGAAVSLRPALLPDAQTRQLRDAAMALVQGRHDEAGQLALATLDAWPDCPLALAIAGEAA
ncbi:MAG: hypothetical protein NUV77_14440, partial [Thermoguttaceae bacterium]|nr:hypothetical protein [Thermoguttaceae bacterium]